MTIFASKDEFTYAVEKTKVLTLLSKSKSPISLGQIHRVTKVPYTELYIVLKHLMDSFAVNEEFIGSKTCYYLVRKTEAV